MSIFKSRSLLNIALVAGIFEWYDYSIFSLLSARYSEIFFSTSHPITGALATYSVIVITYLARPVGSLFFAYLGDRVSRGYALMMSLMLMAVPTGVIGLLPTYSSIGIWSTLILIILRFIQGFAIGGELTNSAVYVFETAPLSQRSFLCSLVSASIGIGFLAGSLSVTGLIWMFDQQEIVTWAWRIPFWLSIPLTGWIWLMRRSIQTPVLEKSLERETKVKQSAVRFRESLAVSKINLFKVFYLGVFGTILTYTFTVWMPFYLSYFIKVPEKIAYALNSFVVVMEILFLILSGILARFVDSFKIYRAFWIAFCMLIFPMIYGLSLGTFGVLLGVHLLFAFLHGGMDGCSIVLVGQLMLREVRSLGVSVNFTLAALVGSMTPMLLTYFTHKTGNLLFSGFYIFAFGLLGLPIVWRLKPTEK